MSGPDRRQDRFFGALLMAIGGLIAGLCGSCTATFLISALGNLSAYPGDSLGLMALVLVVGVMPTILGLLVFRAGLRRYRGRHREPRHPPKTFD